MSQELIGLEYLKKEEIENKRCNTDKPFVFISYSHDSIDTSIVNTVFNKLYDKGLNIWIDTANMPVNEEEWQESAIKALMNHNCKFAFFFRSESSLIKETIKEELTVIKSLNHISSIKTIDIWQDSKYNTSKYKTELLNKGTDYYHSYSVCNQICGVVKPECNALRLAADFKNDINKLVEKMISEAAKAGVYLNSIDEKEYQVVIVNNEKKSSFQIIDGDRVPVQDAGTRDGFEFEGWFVSNTDEEWNFSNPVHEDIEICAKWEATMPDSIEGYKYTIFGEYYEAGSREQGKLMFDAFESLIKRYPGCEEKLTQKTSVARAEDVKNANTPEANPTYFRGCKEFEVNGQKYLVGTSYGFKAKLAEIKGMFKICGADLSEFVLNGEPLKSNGSTGESFGKKSVNNDDIFEYELWGTTHTANKMVDMLNEVFDLIAEKYPGKIKNIADSDNITAVALKADLEQGAANASKVKQFKNYKGKEHSVDGEIYIVNAGYNREGCIKQIERMLILCDENPDVFKITREPEKSTRSVSKSGKEGLGEILN